MPTNALANVVTTILIILAAVAVSLPAPAAAQSSEAQTRFSQGFEAFLSGDYGRARVIWMPIAEAGDAEAQFGIGLMNELGRGFAPNAYQAARWYRRAAGQGHASAQFGLGRLYAMGHGVPRDPTQAVIWYRRAAEQGNVQAQYYLGQSYLEGKGVARDEAAGLDWLNRAAGEGHTGAGTLLAARVNERTLPVAASDPEAAEDGADAARTASPAPAKARQSSEEVRAELRAALDARINDAARRDAARADDTRASGGATETRQSADASAAGDVPARAEEAAVPRAAEPVTEPRAAAEPAPAAEPEKPIVQAARESPSSMNRSEASRATFGVRLGTFGSEADANEEWQALETRHAALLRGLTARITERTIGAHGFHRLDAVSLEGESDAIRLCAALRETGQYCFPIGH